jgi:hypothetical protein
VTASHPNFSDTLRALSRCTRYLPPKHLVQPDNPQCKGYSHWLARGRFGYHRLLCRLHHRDHTPAGACKHCPTPRQQHTSAADRGSLPPGGSTQHQADHFAPASGNVNRATDPPSKMVLFPPSAGTITAMESRCKSVLSPVPTNSKKN